MAVKEKLAGHARLGVALRRQSEELAIERYRTGALRAEVRRLRAELAEAGGGSRTKRRNDDE